MLELWVIYLSLTSSYESALYRLLSRARVVYSGILHAWPSWRDFNISGTKIWHQSLNPSIFCSSGKCMTVIQPACNKSAIDGGMLASGDGMVVFYILFNGKCIQWSSLSRCHVDVSLFSVLDLQWVVIIWSVMPWVCLGTVLAHLPRPIIMRMKASAAFVSFSRALSQQKHALVSMSLALATFLKEVLVLWLKAEVAVKNPT